MNVTLPATRNRKSKLRTTREPPKWGRRAERLQNPFAPPGGAQSVQALGSWARSDGQRGRRGPRQTIARRCERPRSGASPDAKDGAALPRGNGFLSDPHPGLVEFGTDPTRAGRTATTMIRGSWPSNPRQPRRALGWMTDRAAVCGNVIEWFSCFRLVSKWNPGTGGGSFCSTVTRLNRIAYFLEIKSLARPRTPPPSHAEGNV